MSDPDDVGSEQDGRPDVAEWECEWIRWVGRPPLGYLTDWRMELAAHRPRSTREPIGPIARSVGYTSEYAFNRAFTRARGIYPGRFRALVHQD